MKEIFGKGVRYVLDHKALFGAVLASVGGCLSGNIDVGTAVVAVLAALSGGIKKS